MFYFAIINKFVLMKLILIFHNYKRIKKINIDFETKI